MKPQIINYTETDFNEAQKSYARATNRLAVLKTRMEERILKIKADYAEEINELEKSQAEAHQVCETYCRDNKDELFEEKRSIDTKWGRLGFKWSPPSLELCEGKSWEEVCEALKKKLPMYVRVTEAVDKKRLLTDRDEPAVMKICERLGMEAVQKETFFFTPSKIA